MTPTDIEHLRRCIQLAAAARAKGNDPFGSLLVTADGSVVAERENTTATDGDTTAHPELALASWASRNLTDDERATATMYTSGEHCPMCATAQYWAGIGRLVFAMSSGQLRQITSDDQPWLQLDTRTLFGHGNREIVVEGPSDELAGEVIRLFDALGRSAQ